MARSSRKRVKTAEAGLNLVVKGVLDHLRDELQGGSDSSYAFDTVAASTGNPLIRKALRAHAALARRLKCPPHRARKIATVREHGGPRYCSLCRQPMPHRTKPEWRRHFAFAGSRRSNKALLAKYDTHEKRLTWTAPARRARRVQLEEQWLATLDPRTIRVLGREQALRQAITQINRKRDKYHQIALSR